MMSSVAMDQFRVSILLKAPRGAEGTSFTRVPPISMTPSLVTDSIAWLATVENPSPPPCNKRWTVLKRTVNVMWSGQNWGPGLCCTQHGSLPASPRHAKPFGVGPAELKLKD